MDYYTATLDAVSLIDSVWWSAEHEGRELLNHVRYYLNREGAASLRTKPMNTGGNGGQYHVPAKPYRIRG